MLQDLMKVSSPETHNAFFESGSDPVPANVILLLDASESTLKKQKTPRHTQIQNWTACSHAFMRAQREKTRNAERILEVNDKVRVSTPGLREFDPVRIAGTPVKFGDMGMDSQRTAQTQEREKERRAGKGEHGTSGGER